MTTAVREVAYNAEQSTKETQESNQQVDAGAKDIAVTVDAISELAKEINQASSAISTLNDNTAQIDQLVMNSTPRQRN
ncbi:hypothetical protein LZP69_05410 [Shewanella sp. AS1]|nr:hypothetical protein [Shewanella sp. AS1]MCE9678630.1 hypothetical protein [Shewanella sp. AS1]